MALVLSIVSVFAYRVGLRTLEKRAAQKLELVGDASLESVHSAIAERIHVLHVLARQAFMLNVWEDDVDNLIHEALHNTLAQSSMFADLIAMDAAQRIVATTRPSGFGQHQVLPDGTKEALTRLDDALVTRTESGELEIVVPIIYSRLDKPELLGYLRSTGSLAALLPAENGVSIALVDTKGTPLARRRDATSDGELVGSPSKAPRTLDLPLQFSEDIRHDEWSLEFASGHEDLELEAGVLLRTTVFLTLGTALVLAALVGVFSRIEAGLFRKLAHRARELASVNLRLDRSRADLVKAARVAGMSEIAVGILHNAGNALNSVNVSARQCQTHLARSSHGELAKLVEHLRAEEEGLRASLLQHPKGEAFLEYLTEITHRIATQSDQLAAELKCVAIGMSEVAALVDSQQEFASGADVLEECDAEDVLDGALLISNQVHMEGLSLEIERRNLAPGRLQLFRHRAIEILVAVIHNARQSMADAGVAHAKLTLEVAQIGDKIEFRVTDNGVGIRPEHLTEIFHHGFTTRPGANGFGLHAAINAARELGGGLRAESEGQGCGATFVLELPYRVVAEQAA